MLKNLSGLAFGMFFGFMLCWLGFSHYDTILNAVLLRDFYLWEVFVSGVMVAGVGIWGLRAMKARTWLEREPVGWSRAPVSRANVVGGSLFGVGWALAGTCPGPALAQIGSGQLAGLFTAAGIFAGIFVCDRFEHRVSLSLSKGSKWHFF